MLKRLFKSARSGRSEGARAYRRHLRSMMRLHRGDRDLAFADAVGAPSLALFIEQGDGQLAVLRHHGLTDGMAIYDLGCGCGRTGQALHRAGWKGRYIGADVVSDFVAEMMRKCPGAEGHVELEPRLVADSGSLDMVFHWSVFTHISPEDCYLYLEDTFRALKPGGKLVFSFLEITEPQHYPVFAGRCQRLRDGKDLPLVDTFLHRDWISLWAAEIGFVDVRFTEGLDASNHPPMWQTIVSMVRPEAS